MSDAARFREYCGRQSGRRAGHSLHDCDRARRKGHRVCLFTTVEDPDEPVSSARHQRPTRQPPPAARARTAAAPCA